VLLLDWRPIYEIDVLSELGEQSRDLLGTMLKVVVHGHNDLVVGGPDAGEKRVVLTEVTAQHQPVDTPVLASQFHDDIPTCVAAPVVDENQFVRSCHGRERLSHPLGQLW